MTQKRNRKVGNGLIILTLAAFLLIVVRLAMLYVREGVIDPVYRDPKVVSEYYRGSIYDRNGNILAMDSVVYTIVVEKAGLPGISKTAALIAPYTNHSAMEIETMLSDPHQSVLKIKSSMGREKTEEFERLMQTENLGSYITVQRDTERVYPLGIQGRHVIGRVKDGQGLWGAEKMFDGMLLPPLVMRNGIVRGTDVTLALDGDIEYLTYLNALSTRDSDGRALSACLSRDRGELLGLTLYGEWNEEEVSSLFREALSGTPVSMVPRVDTIDIVDQEDRTFMSDGLEAEIIYRDGLIMITASPEPGKALMMIDNMLRMTQSRGLVSSDS